MIRGVETLGMCGEVGIAVRDADLREIDGQRQRGHNQQKIRSIRTALCKAPHNNRLATRRSITWRLGADNDRPVVLFAFDDE